MPFQFLCPQGHLLQGDEAHMGMQCQCPQCGAAFIIPTIDGGAAAAASTADSLDLRPLDAGERPGRLAPRNTAGLGQPSAADLSGIDPAELGAVGGDEPVLHIPCPNGHELETPLDMVGQRAICPHCGVEFRLKREKSVEYLRQEEILDRRRARFWFQLAVMAASFVGFVLVVMIAVMLFS